jgi:copper chaperone CopZ
MEKVTFSIPSMWADHHVLSVRQTLAQVAGVEEVVASSAYKDVLVKYDPATVDVPALANALQEAGYQADQAPALPSHPQRKDDASDWFQFQERITQTDLRDLEMSGDHRKY